MLASFRSILRYMKQCTGCRKVKPYDEFGPEKRNRDGRQARCRKCEKQRLGMWAVDNRERERQRAERFTQEHPDRRREYRRRHKLKTKYGLTLEQYDAWVACVGGRCEVCGCVPNGNLHVDHCHKTKVNRGLLCGNCNRALGILDEDPARITALAEYAAQRCTGGDANEDHLRKSCTPSP